MSANREDRRREDLAGGDGEDLSSRFEFGGTCPLLIGNDIENPGNADGLRAAAAMFGWEHGFVGGSCHSVSRDELAACGLPIVALDNVGGAEDLYRFRPPSGRFVLVVGNERKGIARDVLRLAGRAVQIPMASVHINTVNVAVAAAIALHHLSHGGGGRPIARGGGGDGRGRPEVLLVGPSDAIELGSVVRSAAGFGWERLFIDDRHHIWFDTDRVTRSLGRGAARRGRNPIRVFPARGGGSFEEVCVIGTRADAEPLRRARLAGGPGHLVVLADEAGGEVVERDLARLGGRIRHVRIETEPAVRRPFRLTASIALAEIARQIGAECRAAGRDRSAGRALPGSLDGEEA